MSCISGLMLIYLLAAPPVMIAAFRQGGEAALPSLYKPILRIICSDFGGPMLWYFNDVWHAEVLIIGDNDPTWPITLLYGAFGLILLTGISFPLLKILKPRLGRFIPSR
jgi:hypothetical protein